jgi:hypothetical protein
MGFSDNLAGAGLTVAIPLATLATVVLWGFFGRHPSPSFGGISKTVSKAVGRPDIQTGDTNAQLAAGGVEGRLRSGGEMAHGGQPAAEVDPG